VVPFPTEIPSGCQPFGSAITFGKVDLAPAREAPTRATAAAVARNALFIATLSRAVARVIPDIRPVNRGRTAPYDGGDAGEGRQMAVGCAPLQDARGGHRGGSRRPRTRQRHPGETRKGDPGRR